MRRQLSLNAFLHDTGHHEASWRHPASGAERIGDVEWYQEIAREAEAAKLDAVFLADGPAWWGGAHRPANQFEPITLLTAIAAVTSKIGLIATASTTFYEPYNLARLFASLDQISKGRAGWNIVTTFSEDAAFNFGLDGVPSTEERYLRAQEFVDVVGKLWDSWEDGAIAVDREAGTYVDTGRVHAIDHVGRFLKVRGPFSAPRPPQGRPVYIQAGSSNDGRAFAARNAEAIFTAHQTLEDAQAFYRDIKTKARAFGRDADQVKVLPGISPFVADTAAEAEELYRSFNELTVPAYGLQQLEKMAGVSLGHLGLDERVPLEVFGHAGNVLDNNRSRRQVVANIVERDRPTLRQLLHRLAGGRGHNVVHGTPEQVADTIQTWFESAAADGFNVMPPLYPHLLTAFTQKVVPILQERGLFRTEYAGSTLREHYGLARPVSQYAASQTTAALA
ncbi:LLM class flavin-dependent oxidoreductase [Nocardioides gansuensis]|uniref:LLM class flavin-dependent oxidoreductase n=1 Tax=Nocardioides gansuensis TaxID=2138300 RepID=A0A2T8F7Q8_9ACTN|nr:LLM class flavin-dependent oxidoreductase [Nocardioides gansuensis]PVG81754.1 LLM class flavin-dependent oxidoreductase [Nocardioides gansuensis]